MNKTLFPCIVGEPRFLSYALLALLLAGCVSQPSQPPSRYQQQHDSGPLGYHDLAKVPDAVPRIEPVSPRGNLSPYQVAGVNYRLLPTSQGYRQQGLASWYGAKFHGHETSNGETYNMFGMSAAHRSLPIPTYLEVVNLENGRKVIVRVNDRGPFHSERIIDLSYAAAVKLGFADQGTARVRLKAIDPVVWQQAQQEPADAPVYLQVGAFVRVEAAQQLQRRLQALTDESVVVHLDRQQTPKLHKVKIGPLQDRLRLEQIKEKLTALGLGQPLVVPSSSS